MRAHTLLHLLSKNQNIQSFKENFLVFNRESRQNPSSIPEKQESAAKEAEIVKQYTESAVKKLDEEFKDPKKTVEKIGNLPEIALSQNIDNDSDHLWSYFNKNVGEKLFPTNTYLQSSFGIQLDKSFYESITDKQKKLISERKAVRMNFTSEEKNGEAYLKCHLLGKDGKEVNTFDVPMLSQLFKKTQERREFIKENCRADRESEMARIAQSILELGIADKNILKNRTIAIEEKAQKVLEAPDSTKEEKETAKFNILFMKKIRDEELSKPGKLDDALLIELEDKVEAIEENYSKPEETKAETETQSDIDIQALEEAPAQLAPTKETIKNRIAITTSIITAIYQYNNPNTVKELDEHVKEIEALQKELQKTNLTPEDYKKLNHSFDKTEIAVTKLQQKNEKFAEEAEKRENAKIVNNYPGLTKDSKFEIPVARELDQARNYNLENFKKNWKNIEGAEAVEEIIMNNSAFRSIPRNRVAETVFKIIDNGAVGVPGSTDFDDVMDILGETEGFNLNYGYIKGNETLESDTSFRKEFKRLSDKGDNRSEVENIRYQIMKQQVLIPSIKLLQAIQNLRLNTVKTEKGPEPIKSNTELLKNKLIDNKVVQLKTLTQTLNDQTGRNLVIGNKIPGTNNYRILLDGKNTNPAYVLHLEAHRKKSYEPYKIVFEIEKENEFPKIKGWEKIENALKDTRSDEEILKTEYMDFSREIEDNREINDLEDAIKKIKENGIIFHGNTKPEKLTNNQFYTFIAIGNEIQSAFNKNNVTDAIFHLESIQRDFVKLKNSIKFATHENDIHFIINKGDNQFIEVTPKQLFGKNNKQLILDLKRKQLSPESYKKYIQESKARAMEQEQVGLSKTDIKANYMEFTKDHRFSLSGIRGSFKIDKGYTTENGWSKDSFKRNWENLDGYKRVEEIMKKPPFQFNREEVANQVLAIYSSGRTAGVFDFDDLMDLYGETGKLNIDYGIVPKKFLKSNTTFTDEIKRLENKGNNRTKIEEKRYNYMRNSILVPSIQLLHAIEGLRLDQREYISVYDTKRKEKQIAKEYAELPENEKLIIGGLEKLTGYKERDTNGWEEFMGWIGGAKSADKFYMSDFDGNNCAIDRGRFNRYNTQGASIRSLIYSKGLYKVEEGKITLNEKEITSEINKLMKLGLANKILKEETQKGSKPSIKDVFTSTQFKQRLAQDQITSIKQGSFSTEQMQAFQYGFILDQTSKNEREIETGKEALVKDPRLQGIVDQLLQQGADKKTIAEVQDKMLAGLGFHVKNGELVGGGAGLNVKLSDGATLTVGFAVTKSGGTPGLAFTGKILEGSGGSMHFTMGMSMAGLGTGLAGTVKIGNLNANLFGGTFWNSVSMGIGGGISFSWDMAKQLEQDKEKYKNTSELKDAWDLWKGLPKSAVDARYKALKKIPTIWHKAEALQKEFELKNADIVHMIEEVEEEIDDQAVADLHHPLYFISSIGISMVGPIPVPTIGIVIGEAKVYVPNRRAINKMKEELSDARISKKINEAIKTIETGNIDAGEFSFSERMPEQAYAPDGSIMLLTDANKVDFNKVKISDYTFDVQKINEQLKTANVDMEIREVEKAGNGKKGKYEIILPKPIPKYGKDEEIYVDQTLEDLGLVKDGKRLFLIGNISDLVITRQRYFLPAKGSASMSSLRDVVTFRKRESTRGSVWMQRNNKAFLSRKEGADHFDIKEGAKYKGYGDIGNIIDAPGYATDIYDNGEAVEITDALVEATAEKRIKAGNPGISNYELQTKMGLEKAKVRAEFQEKNATIMRTKEAREKIQNIDRHQNVLGKFFTPQEATAYGKNYQSMQQGTDQKIGAREAYEKEKVTPEFYQNLDKLWGEPHKNLSRKQRQFRSRFRRNIDNPGKLVRFIVKYSKGVKGLEEFSDPEKASDPGVLKKLNYAQLYFVFKHFTTLYPKGALENKSLKEKKEANKKIIRALKKRRNFTRNKVFIPKFQKTIQNLDPNLNETQTKKLAAKIADKMMDNIYGPLFNMLDPKKITTAENWKDFRDLDVKLIPAGAQFTSGSRNLRYEKKDGQSKLKETGAAAETVNYGHGEDLKFRRNKGLGLLNDTTTEYKLKTNKSTTELIEEGLKSEEPSEALMARVLFETDRPSVETAKENAELFEIPFVKKLLAVKGFMFLFTRDNYKKIAEARSAVKAGEEITRDQNEALNQLKELTEKIENARITGETLEIKCPEKTSFTFTFEPRTVVMSGAFSKCSNASYFTNSTGVFKITGPGKVGVIAVYDESHEKIDAKTDKMIISLGIGVGVERHKIPEERTPAKGLKNLDKAPAKEGKTITDSGTTVVPKGSPPPARKTGNTPQTTTVKKGSPPPAPKQ